MGFDLPNKAPLTTEKKQLYSTLKIHSYYSDVPYEVLIEDNNFTTIGLIKKSPSFVKGVKVSSEYHSDNSMSSSTLVVKKTFTDVLSSEDMVIGINIIFEWYNHEGNVALTKLEFKPLNEAEVWELQRKRRQRAISYLQAGSRNTPIEPYVSALLTHYKNDIDLYIQGNTSGFYDAVIAETEQPYLTYLGIVINTEGATVKDSILIQIT